MSKDKIKISKALLQSFFQSDNFLSILHKKFKNPNAIVKFKFPTFGFFANSIIYNNKLRDDLKLGKIILIIKFLLKCDVNINEESYSFDNLCVFQTGYGHPRYNRASYYAFIESEVKELNNKKLSSEVIFMDDLGFNFENLVNATCASFSEHLISIIWFESQHKKENGFRIINGSKYVDKMNAYEIYEYMVALFPSGYQVWQSEFYENYVLHDIPISSINRRTGSNSMTVKKYANLKTEIPPIILHRVKYNRFEIVDGGNRVEAAISQKKTTILAYVGVGNLIDFKEVYPQLYST
ncbi:MAG: ParB/RepB/Spo0J family partition protein [Nanoarchaeota archaeon]|nr:ParB/RepB/Spo0J family partition protein [Nanoarchaeota archaeon]